MEENGNSTYCPVCLRRLSTQAAATMHFRSHVRKGEADLSYGHPGSFCLAHPTQPLETAHWSTGFMLLQPEKTLEYNRERFFAKQLIRRPCNTAMSNGEPLTQGV